MRLHRSSAGLDPARLVPGEDLVLSFPHGHGEELPFGVAIRDHLDPDERGEIDGLALRSLRRWRSMHDEQLTQAGICWPFIWEWELFAEVFLPVLGTAAAFGRALAAVEPKTVELHGLDALSESIVRAVAGVRGVQPVTVREPDTRSAAAAESVNQTQTLRSRRAPAHRRARRAVLQRAMSLGAPSHLAADAVVMFSYWPMMPLLDRMLAERRWRPAVVSQSPPTGVGRSLRAAASGGWMGRPGPLELRRAHGELRTMITRLSDTSLILDGVELGALLDSGSLALARLRGALDLATAAHWRRALGRGRARVVVVPFDHDPVARLLVHLANEAGVPTVVFQHGAYVIPTELSDMTVAEHAALWTPETAPPVSWSREPWLIGYPFAHDPPGTRQWSGGGHPRVAVLSQPCDRGRMLNDERDVMRHYATAVAAVAEALADAQIVLRPHPADDLRPALAVAGRSRRVEIDVSSDLLTLLAGCDLCIGGPSTATLQSALVGTPAVVLNVTASEWRWPLGGATTVPIARSHTELVHWSGRWLEGAVLPGREDLLAGLGATGGDASNRFLSHLARLSKNRTPGAR